MTILGFDLGQKYGFAALSEDGQLLQSGTWDFGKRSGQSLTYLFGKISNFIAAYKPTHIGYEKIGRYRGAAAAHAWGGYLALLLMGAYLYNVPLIAVTVQQVKLTATDRGNADKLDMQAAALDRWAHCVEDDNEADALWVAEC